MNNLAKGKLAEQQAATFLEQAGYHIVARNYRYRRGEIDLIAQREELLVFVEVKMRSSTIFGFPEEAVNAKKEELILQTADNYLQETNFSGNVRFDIIAIAYKNGKPELSHFEDAFG